MLCCVTVRLRFFFNRVLVMYVIYGIKISTLEHGKFNENELENKQENLEEEIYFRISSRTIEILVFQSCGSHILLYNLKERKN